jgi:hypothetical protein
MSFAVEFDSLVHFRVWMRFGWPCGKGQAHSGSCRSGPHWHRSPKVLYFASPRLNRFISLLREMISELAPLAGTVSVHACTICFTGSIVMLRCCRRAAKPYISRTSSSRTGTTIKYNRVDVISTPVALVWHACCTCSSLCVHYLLSKGE